MMRGDTLHLMRSHVNASRLNRAVAQIEAGKGKQLPLLQPRPSGRIKRGKTISGGARKARTS